MKASQATMILGLVATALLPSGAASQGSRPAFNQFQVPLYQGPINVPAIYHKDESGAWRDEADKSVAEPSINFAGVYTLRIHSCGTNCSWYSLYDLRTGKQLSQINMFASAEPLPTTKDGHPYSTRLESRPGSRLLIARYIIDPEFSGEKQACRERYFLIEGGHIQPTSRTFLTCTQ